jgi:hypothetical protein
MALFPATAEQLALDAFCVLAGDECTVLLCAIIANWVVDWVESEGRGDEPSHVTAQENRSPLPWSGRGTRCHRSKSSRPQRARIANQVFATRVARATHG